MEIFILIFGFCFISIFSFKYGYEKGFDEREEIFQEKNIIFTVGVENVAIVSRENSILQIQILNSKLAHVTFLDK